ncbi:hypothetical protein EPUS_02779 [Endocarpon pusillum Z07020]|uniref:tRNA wybutosine-synthesizing protein 2 n=1 Tax=Endocarpon pusillum (strain Z07020 / HMAS-L-300199) TaxID=1263415 RepID=U1G8J8_ENDPU|nr:uncharacterized protein EPUS_02779 [Endocarpon pusillum Z07020]ERF68323.1 hypothetical protein EPUS_02779 [Endocarpon pusillum Z07020]
MPTFRAQPPVKSSTQHNNPLQKAFYTFLHHYISNQDTAQEASNDFGSLLSSMPKRYTLYPPLLLLPTNIFSTTPTWTAFISQLSSGDLQIFYKFIIEAFKHQGVTHIAINAPISSLTPHGISNTTRIPSGLVPLSGDFGPRSLLSSDNDPSAQPLEADFSAAFWVHTTQNGGIFQTWAPLWTMFSRGNISEKARILSKGTFDGLDGADGMLQQDLREIAVVDMYVGIGYFAFSYLKRGIGRVFGWEVNGWSVEGLRRGCEGNGWAVRVLNVGDEGLVRDGEGRFGQDALEVLVAELGQDSKLRMVVFQGDNQWAGEILTKIKALSGRMVESGDSCSWLDVRHINLGLLPTSRMSWNDAIDMLDQKKGGWIHVHENVDIWDIEGKRESVLLHFRSQLGDTKAASCSHVEQVKTYAPGVMHCVFDIHIEPKPISPGVMGNG